MKIKKCLKCGATVKVLEDCTCLGCGIMCCEEEMKELEPNTSDGAVEKHKPNCEVKEGLVYVTVDHVMEEDHYIEWISYASDKKEETVYFKPEEIASACFEYVPGFKVYAYCNKHGLWESEV